MLGSQSRERRERPLQCEDRRLVGRRSRATLAAPLPPPGGSSGPQALPLGDRGVRLDGATMPTGNAPPEAPRARLGAPLAPGLGCTPEVAAMLARNGAGEVWVHGSLAILLVGTSLGGCRRRVGALGPEDARPCNQTGATAPSSTGTPDSVRFGSRLRRQPGCRTQWPEHTSRPSHVRTIRPSSSLRCGASFHHDLGAPRIGQGGSIGRPPLSALPGGSPLDLGVALDPSNADPAELAQAAQVHDIRIP